jgi:hypothetical protein
MIKTQIQLPDALYLELKRVAREREMSLAEVLRRGAEYITQVYLPVDTTKQDDGLPGPFHAGVKADPFADPDWRYHIHENSCPIPLVREERKKTYGKKKRLKS